MHVEEINPWDSPGIPSWTTADAVELPAKVYVQVIANHMEDLAAHHLTLRVAQLLQRSKGYYINKGITGMELTSINLELRSRLAFRVGRLQTQWNFQPKSMYKSSPTTWKILPLTIFPSALPSCSRDQRVIT